MTTAQATLARQMPPPKFVDVNGVRLAYYEVRPDCRDTVGPPLVLCHGFPELAFSWRRQLRALKDAGRWAIAPDQRGFGLTSGPQAVEDYDIEHLTDDLIGLLDHVGAEKAVWCGHDWGGLVVWQMALRHPDRTAGVVALNTPFMPRLPMDPVQLLRSVRGEDHYIVHFQKPGEADRVLNARLRDVFDMLMRRPDPATRAADAARGVSPSFVGDLEAFDPASDGRATFLDPGEFEVFVETFERTSFTPGIDWYRNFTRNWELSAELPDRIDGVPCLMITAELDAVIPPSAAAHMPAIIADLETVLVEGSGHWTQQEKPHAVNRILLDWLGRRIDEGASLPVAASG